MNFDGGAGSAYWNDVSQFKSTIEDTRDDLTTYYSTFEYRDVYKSTNCTLLQEPIEEMRNALCSRFYPIVQSLNIGLMMMGWAGIVFMMTTVCTGVRQFKNDRNTKRNAVVALDQPSEYKFVEREPNKSKIYFIEGSQEDLFQKRPHY